MTISDRIRVKDVRLLSDNHYVLKSTTFEYRRANGEWQTQHRETYDRGNGATLLPYNLARRTVVLVKQFRYPAYVNGYDDLMIEAAAGLLDNASPENRIRAEAEEETGYRLGAIKKVFEAFMSPGSMTESLCTPSLSVCKHWNRVGVDNATRATFPAHRRFDRLRRQVVRTDLMRCAGNDLYGRKHTGFDKATYRVVCDA